MYFLSKIKSLYWMGVQHKKTNEENTMRFFSPIITTNEWKIIISLGNIEYKIWNTHTI